MKNAIENIKDFEEQDRIRRLAYEECAKDEVPKLRNINAVLAYDYFKHGWDAAKAETSKKLIAVDKNNFNFSETNIQIATVMTLTGTAKQKE